MATEDASLPYESLENLELHQVFLKFLEKETYTDVEFQVQCDADFISYKAHKLPLSIFSPVFEDMFYSLPGSYDNPVIINDVSPNVFSVMLRFVYGDVCELKRQERDVAFLLKLYRAAISYQIEALQSICRNRLASMSPDRNNVFQLLDAAQLTGDEGIRLRCLRVLETRTAEILANQSDLGDVSPAMMMTILSLERVSFESEFELATWVFSWAANEHLKHPGRTFRNVLDDVLGHVDFTAMTPEHFGKVLSNHDVFSESEIAKIFRNIVDPGGCDLPSWVSADIRRVYSYRG